MRIATILGIAVLGMSGVAVAQVGSTPAEQQSDQATTNNMTDNGTSGDDMSTDNSMSAPDNGMAPNDDDTTAPDNTMTPPGV